MTSYYYFKLLLLNLLGLNRLPVAIKYNNMKWDLHLAQTKDGWMLMYIRFIQMNEGMMREDLINVVNKSKYKCYLQMLNRLWHMSDDIEIL